MNNPSINLKVKYLDKNSQIFSHGRSYLCSAMILEESLADHPNNIYPILTLLGLSIELFFKGLDVIDTSEKYQIDGLVFSGPHQTKTNLKGGHDLQELFESMSHIDHDMYTYLLDEFSRKYNYNLLTVLEKNKKIFINTRYAYENSGNRKYISEFNEILNTANFLYESFNKLISEIHH